ncbi:hypothetical protein EVJ58_g8639 [Rhodofomes roseus]|nr:hypothetical protein EVJ58_g8639 [Rhodofomes roseus]
MRPEFKSLITSAQESEIFDLIGRLIQTLGSPEIAIDERHTPKLHARFLAGLLTKHRRDTATAGRIQTQQQPPPSQVSPHSQVSSSGSTHTFSASGSAGTSPGDTAFPGGSMGYAGEGHLILGSGQGEPVYQEDTAYAAGTGPLEVFDFGAVAGQGIETLGALQALQNPSYWRDMMMPGYSWPENNDSYGLNGNMGGFGQNFGALQTAEVGLFG